MGKDGEKAGKGGKKPNHSGVRVGKLGQVMVWGRLGQGIG